MSMSWLLLILIVSMHGSTMKFTDMFTAYLEYSINIIYSFNVLQH